MARTNTTYGRIIRADFANHPDFDTEEHWVTTLILWMITNASAEGRVRADPGWLRRKILLRSSEVHTPKVSSVGVVLRRFITLGWMVDREFDGVKYYEFTNWGAHQVIHPSIDTSKKGSGSQKPETEEPERPTGGKRTDESYREYDQRRESEREALELKARRARDQARRKADAQAKADAMSQDDTKSLVAALKASRAKVIEAPKNGGI